MNKNQNIKVVRLLDTVDSLNGVVVEKDGNLYLDYGGNTLLPLDNNQSINAGRPLQIELYSEDNSSWREIVERCYRDKGVVKISFIDNPNNRSALLGDDGDAVILFNGTGSESEIVYSCLRKNLPFHLEAYLAHLWLSGGSSEAKLANKSYERQEGTTPILPLASSVDLPKNDDVVEAYFNNLRPPKLAYFSYGQFSISVMLKENLCNYKFGDAARIRITKVGGKNKKEFLSGIIETGISRKDILPGRRYHAIIDEFFPGNRKKKEQPWINVRIEGNLFPVRVESIPHVDTRLNNYMYPRGKEVEVKTSEELLEDNSPAYVDIVDLSVNYPFLEGKTYSCLLDNFFVNLSVDSHDYHFYISPEEQLGKLHNRLFETNTPETRNIEFEVQFKVDQYGDPEVRFKSLIQERLRGFPDGFVFPAIILATNNRTVIWQYLGIIGTYKICDGPVPSVGDIIHLTVTGWDNGWHQLALVQQDEEKEGLEKEGLEKEGNLNNIWGYQGVSPARTYTTDEICSMKQSGVAHGSVIGYNGIGHYIQYGEECIGYLPNDNLMWGVCFDAFGYFHENEPIEFCFSGVLNHGFPELTLLDLIFKPHIKLADNELLSNVYVERVFPTAIQVRYANLALQIPESEINLAGSKESLEHLFSPKEKIDVRVLKGGSDVKSIRFSLRLDSQDIWHYCPLKEGELAIGRACKRDDDSISVMIKRYPGVLVGNHYGIRDGQTICVRINEVDIVNGTMTCSFAGVIPDNWNITDFAPGRIHDAIVEQVFEDGSASVRIKGFYGRIDASDYGPNGRNETIGVGSNVKVMVLDADPSYLTLRLSYRFGNGIPKEMIPFQLGCVHRFRVSEVYTGGVTEWLKLDVPNFPLMHGMVPQKELAWISSDRFSGKYQVGQEIEALVYEIRPDISAFKASIRRLSPDPRAIDQLNINEKLNVTVVHYFPEKNYVSVKYGQHVGILEVDSSYWKDVIGAQDGFFRNKKEIEACLKSKEQNELVFSLPENEYGVDWESIDLHQGDVLYELDVIDVCSSYLFVKYEGLVVGMTRSQLSWFKSFPIPAFYSVGDTIDVVVNAYSSKEHKVQLQVLNLDSFSPSTIPVWVGGVYPAEFLSKNKDGFHLRCNSVPVLLRTSSFPRGIAPMIIEDGILVQISEIDIERRIIWATCDSESIQDPISEWKEGVYVNLTVQKSSTEKGVLLMYNGYAAVIPVDKAKNGEYSIEECYHKGDEILVRITEINGSHIIAEPSYLNPENAVMNTAKNSFEAEICWRSPSEGIVLRNNGLFYMANVEDNFNQPYEQISRLGNLNSVEVIALGKEKNGLPCVQIKGYSPASLFNIDIQCGDVISVREVGKVEAYSILFYEKESLFLLMDANEATPLDVDEFKVRVLIIDKTCRRIIVSRRAVRDNPFLYLLPGEKKYEGRLIQKGATNFIVSVNPNGKGAVNGLIKGKISGHFNNEIVEVYVEHVQITDTLLGGKARHVLFSFTAPSNDKPQLGRRVKCKMKPGKSGPCTFKWNGKELDAYLPASERFWYNDNWALTDFDAVIIGEDDDNGYIVSHKSCFINPLLCSTEGERINVKIVNVVENNKSRGVAVEYKGGISFIPFYEMANQKIDLPQKKWAIGQIIPCIVTKCVYDLNDSRNNGLRLSHRLALPEIDFTNEVWREQVYSATVLRVGKEGNSNCMVVKLDGTEIEATIAQRELRVFYEGLSEIIPEPNSRIAEVGIKDVIYDNHGIPHVFAYVIRKKW